MTKGSRRLRAQSRPAHLEPTKPAGPFPFFWPLLQSLAILAGGLYVFWPTLHGQWIGDDSWYISENPLLNDPQRLWKAWFQPGSWVEYYPIEETVQWLQWQIWREDTLGYHWTNILLHLTSAFLIWRLLAKFKLPLAWLGGLLFVVHPMTVDSVALMNELKASLSLPPFLLALCYWIDYEENKKTRDYALALSFFLIAMLCKITMAMFPFVILLYAWWKRGGITLRDIRTSVPFFIVSLVLGMATIRAGEIYAKNNTFLVADNPQGDLLWRTALSGETIAFYFSRCFLPITPLAIYPQWKVAPYSPLPYLFWLVLAGMISILWIKRRSWGRHGLLGLGFFLIMLAPFWGFHWVAYMNATWALDHLLYLPMIGLIGLVVASMGEVMRQLSTPGRWMGGATFGVAILFMAWESHSYACRFEDEETLAAYNLSYNPNSAGLHNNLGVVLARKGHLSEAVDQFQAVLLLDPHSMNASQNRGKALLELGRIQESVEQQEMTVRLAPNLSLSHLSLGDSLIRAGRLDEAIAQYQEAVRLEPDSALGHYYLGLALRQKEAFAEAIEQFRLALAIDPKAAQAYNSLGIALYLEGRVSEARASLQKAISLDPDYADARNNLLKIDAQNAPSANEGKPR